MAKAVINYPGGKWRFWDHLKWYIPRDIKDWREPFFGGGSMSLSIADDSDFRITKMQTGDLSKDVANFWIQARNRANEVYRVCEDRLNILGPTTMKIKEKSSIYNLNKLEGDTLRIVREEGEKVWDWSFNVDDTEDDDLMKACKFYICNLISFSSLGYSGTLSYEGYMKLRNRRIHSIVEMQPLLQRMDIRNAEYQETMEKLNDSDSFIFLDPPYYRQEQSKLYGRGGDTHYGFNHEELAKFLHDTKARWLMTYDDSVKIRQLYHDMNIIEFKLPGGYVMSGRKSDKALDGEELFITNYDIENTAEDEDWIF